MNGPELKKGAGQDLAGAPAGVVAARHDITPEASSPEAALPMPLPMSLREKLIATLLFAFPLFIISVKSWASGIYYLLAVLALVSLARPQPPLRREEWVFIGTLVAWLASTLIANSLSGWTAASIGWYEADARFLLAIPVYLVLRAHPGAVLALFRGVPVAALLAGGYVIYQTTLAPARIDGPYGPIFAGNISALLAVMSLATLRFPTWPRRLRIPLHLLAFALALGATVLSGTRSAWLAVAIAMPLLVWVIPAGSRWARKRLQLLLGLGALIVAVLAIAVATEPRLTQERLLLAVEQTENFFGAESAQERARATRGSIGLRLEQWRVGLLIAAEHPLFGVGVGNAAPYLNRHVEAGTASTSVRVADDSKTRGTHLHSAFMDALVFKGAVGLAALLCLLFYPVWLGLRAENRTMPAAGVLVILAAMFAVFCLTEDPFIRNNFTSVYVVFLTSVMALLLSPRARP